MKWFLAGLMVVALLCTGFGIGRGSAPQPAPPSYAQRDQAVSVIAAEVAQSIALYDVQWDAPLSTDSVTLLPDGNEAVVEHVEAGGFSYTLRGVVSPTGILVGHIKELAHRRILKQ